MSATRRVRASVRAGWRSFLRRRTAVFFTFFFPLIIVVIFGALVRTEPTGGLFAEDPGYYVPGYLAVVVLFTPLSRVGSEVARHREGNRFEKLATTLTSVCASSHSPRESGVVASFSKRLPSRWRATSLPTRDSGVNSTTTAR